LKILSWFNEFKWILEDNGIEMIHREVVVVVDVVEVPDLEIRIVVEGLWMGQVVEEEE
jgi:hypothetical protein